MKKIFVLFFVLVMCNYSLFAQSKSLSVNTSTTVFVPGISSLLFTQIVSFIGPLIFNNLSVNTFVATNTVYLFTNLVAHSQSTNFVINFSGNSEQCIYIPLGGIKILHATNLWNSPTNVYVSIDLWNTNATAQAVWLPSGWEDLGGFNGWITNHIVLALKNTRGIQQSNVCFGVAGR